MMLARLSARRRVAERKHLHRVRFISTVHDSIVLDTPSEHLEELTILFNEVFRDLPANIWKLFKYEWVTPLACESKAGPNMKDQTKLKYA